MTREEFEQMMKTEQENGTSVAGTVTNKRELMKMSLGIKKAMGILYAVKESAAVKEDMDLLTACIFAEEGLEIIFDKVIEPIMDQVKCIDQAHRQEEPAEDE